MDMPIAQVGLVGFWAGRRGRKYININAVHALEEGDDAILNNLFPQGLCYFKDNPIAENECEYAIFK